LTDDVLGRAELMRRRRRRVPPPQPGFAGFRFRREVIVLAVRWDDSTLTTDPGRLQRIAPDLDVNLL
jgi:hypothetical protein